MISPLRARLVVLAGRATSTSTKKASPLPQVCPGLISKTALLTVTSRSEGGCQKADEEDKNIGHRIRQNSSEAPFFVIKLSVWRDVNIVLAFRQSSWVKSPACIRPYPSVVDQVFGVFASRSKALAFLGGLLVSFRNIATMILLKSPPS